MELIVLRSRRELMLTAVKYGKFLQMEWLIMP
jgi:hypothetical protein